MHLVFADEPDGSFESRPGFTAYANQVPGAAFLVADGQLTNAATEPREAAAYLLTDMGGQRSLRARFTLRTYGRRRLRDKGGVMVGAWAEDILREWSKKPDSPCHLMMTPTHWTYAVFRDHAIVPIARGFFFPRLAADGLTEHEVEVRFLLGGGAVEVRLPNGSVRQIRHPAVRGDQARQACFELYQANASLDARAAFIEVWTG